MSAFTGPLTITEISADKELWRLEEDLVFYIDYKEADGVIVKSGEIIVPKGFISDGASVPYLLERLYPRWGKWRRAAVLHDFVCSLIDMKIPHFFVPNRDVADRVFLKAMEAVKVQWFDKMVMYWGARLGTKFPSLGKSSIRNADGFDYLIKQSSKSPAVITNKGELLIDLFTGIQGEEVNVQTNHGTVIAEQELERN